MLDNLFKGQTYTRGELAELWGFKGRQAISRGVVTKKGEKFIFLFITKEKQKSFTQYDDHINDNTLYFEGETGHGNDVRIVNARKNGDEVHLFFREIHHTPFEYKGRVFLKDYELNLNLPSRFEFDLLDDDQRQLSENKKINTDQSIGETQKEALIKCRVGQGKFRKDLIKFWEGCSVTDVKNHSLLKASHIKPWSVSTNEERLDVNNGLLLTPTLDHLFDQGFISFDENGKIVISKQLSLGDSEALNVNSKMRIRRITEKMKRYLIYHRKNILR